MQATTRRSELSGVVRRRERNGATTPLAATATAAAASLLAQHSSFLLPLGYFLHFFEIS